MGLRHWAWYDGAEEDILWRLLALGLSTHILTSYLNDSMLNGFLGTLQYLLNA